VKQAAATVRSAISPSNALRRTEELEHEHGDDAAPEQELGVA
jgi:hypothetical protein